jgi:hypothetical protein
VASRSGTRPAVFPKSDSEEKDDDCAARPQFGGKIGYVLMWLLGVPIPASLVVYVLFH